MFLYFLKEPLMPVIFFIKPNNFKVTLLDKTFGYFLLSNLLS